MQMARVILISPFFLFSKTEIKPVMASNDNRFWNQRETPPGVFYDLMVNPSTSSPVTSCKTRKGNLMARNSRIGQEIHFRQLFFQRSKLVFKILQ